MTKGPDEAEPSATLLDDRWCAEDAGKHSCCTVDFCVKRKTKSSSGLETQI
jgi:hypothetical protein